MLPRIFKSEQPSLPILSGIRSSPNDGDQVEDFMKACEEHADAQRVADYNAGSLAGVSPVQLCTDGTGGLTHPPFNLQRPVRNHV